MAETLKQMKAIEFLRQKDQIYQEEFDKANAEKLNSKLEPDTENKDLERRTNALFPEDIPEMQKI